MNSKSDIIHQIWLPNFLLTILNKLSKSLFNVFTYILDNFNSIDT